MKIKQTYILLSILSIFFLLSVAYYYQTSKNQIPQKVLAHNETDINVDQIRFIFRMQNLCQRGITSYLHTINSINITDIDSPVEYYEAALGFMNINFTKIPSINNYVGPRIKKIIDLIEENDPTKLHEIHQLNNEIIYYLGGKEKETWEIIHSKYTNFTTDKFSNIYLYQSLTALVIYILFVLLVILYIQNKLSAHSKRDQQTLLEQSKNASMGEMIGNIAHQWRQPLSIISTGATGLKIQKEYNTLTDEQFIQTCDAINDNAQYLSKTIDDFKNFIKNDRKHTKFSLKENIDSFLNLVEPSLKRHNIKLILQLDENIEIIGYSNELIQCYMNIFNNAKDALKDSPHHDKYFFIETYNKDNQVIIKFKDNADGIPENILPRIFEPYFTTKHQSHGTGLGLHMTYNLINDGMNGTISAQNVNFNQDEHFYQGAEFTITLPLSLS